MAALTKLLQSEGYAVICASDKTNKIFRLLAMCYTIIKHRKTTDVVLIDTFSTSNFYYALITSQLARLLSLKYIPILHGGNLPKRLKHSEHFSSLIFKYAEINVSPSLYLIREFQKYYYETVYIPNSIPIAEIPFKLRTNLEPKLLWVRAFDEIYNPFMAIKVLYLLKKNYKNASLCMVGPDKDGSLNQTKELAKQLGVANSVTFTGVLPKEQWHQMSGSYDVFINTTNIDNMPVSIIEAMALGLPIVSTNAGGLPYLIENGVDGLLIPVKDERKMAEAIETLLSNAEKAGKMSKNAREKAEKFDEVWVKTQWIKLLKNV
ncbi:MAG: glycosyltransferase family 4 protein [Lutibacter sp.]|nr:glycosyltransferase family 4 protein [Lutibacter sp.]